MQIVEATYSNGVAVTPSDTTPINCRGIYVGGTGNLTISFSPTATPVTFTAPVLGTIIPISLDQGRIMAATTATLIIALQ